MANRKIGQAGLALIKQYEGCRLAAYRCAAGVWTIGYGHTAGVHSGMTITQAQADAYLQQDIAKFEGYVNNPAYVPITEQSSTRISLMRWSALPLIWEPETSGSFAKGRTTAQIAQAMTQYCKANGKVLAGLRRRRAAEAGIV